uniref:Uncharacterized protein n=1 Tax=Anguilla anguilla TaxID=7936 RepID=A0A0E9PZD1_ANGAN
MEPSAELEILGHSCTFRNNLLSMTKIPEEMRFLIGRTFLSTTHLSLLFSHSLPLSRNN